MQLEIQEFAVFYVPPRKLWYTEIKIDHNRFISCWIMITEKEESLSNMKSEHMYVHTNACISDVQFQSNNTNSNTISTVGGKNANKF
jgi:hypothetical protein